MQEIIDKLKTEASELTTKLGNLRFFTEESKIFLALPEEEQSLLYAQDGTMTVYINILRARISLLEKREGLTYEGYPYRYMGEKLNLYQTQNMLVDAGYDMFQGLDEMEFSEDVMNIQDGPNQIKGLERRFYGEYRGGEINKTRYAMDASEAIDKMCEWNHHLDMWEVSEEE